MQQLNSFPTSPASQKSVDERSVADDVDGRAEDGEVEDIFKKSLNWEQEEEGDDGGFLDRLLAEDVNLPELDDSVAELF